MYLAHYSGTGVLGPDILTSRTSEDPLLVRSPLLMEVGQYYIHTYMHALFNYGKTFSKKYNGNSTIKLDTYYSNKNTVWQGCRVGA